ncbi:MAG: 2'-5' RNA ligase family protein [Chloroflexi bacterium]|jgi:2'-5' RNA ligase|nr:2'-5' RNA ligase family protein [Chloroflexota bacterium]MBT3668653.1 2'-5' RNA ligase family protein [Chloroflexota bacterium]MBT4002024.1 2'-5' RNA ligase family protein [Chloroflexota bacterium]MBT4304156.1 2'-5' RNA ligase family protein [Chloroflexota bacterium]MBT4533210.1 2'-5' RNA ligase family protein [Chloroflexota bacterium]
MSSHPPILLYPDVFHKFLNKKKTVANIDRDFYEWHLGRKKYSLWGITISSNEIEERIKSAHKQLGDYLLSPYSRQSHITLFVCGFLNYKAKDKDDYSLEQLDLQIKNLRNEKINPFSIEIGGINSFLISPFLEVEDTESGIKKIRHALSIRHKENRQEKYVPHITFGLYSGEYSTKKIAEKFSKLGAKTVYKVDHIKFLYYDPANINGLLKTEKIFWF